MQLAQQEAPAVADSGVCALCGGGLGRVLLVHDTPDRFELHLGIPHSGYRRIWRECAACAGATNLHAPGNLERLNAIAAQYYEVDFAGSSIADKYAKVMALPPEKSDNAGRVQRVLDQARKFGGPCDRALKVLDIGAGTGVFLALLMKRAAAECLRIAATAVEPDPNAAAHLRSLGLFETVEGLFHGQPELFGQQLVSLNKVVEHARDPLSLVKAAGAALDANNGIIYVEVPDVLTIGRRPPTDNILGSLHHHLYSPVALDVLFRAADLVTLTISRVFEPSGKITLFGFAAREARIERLAVQPR